MNETLKELVEKARDGETKALERLIKYKHGNIFYLVMRYTKNPQDAEDQVQEVLINMIKDLPNLKNAEAFDSWLYAIIKHVCSRKNSKIAFHNKKSVPIDFLREELKEELKENQREFLPVEYVEDKEKRKIVLREIDALPDNYKESLLLHYYQEMSFQEVAAARGVTQKKVYNDIMHAKMKLKERLERVEGKEITFSVVPVGAIPVLTQILIIDAKESITTAMSGQLMSFANKAIAGQTAKSTVSIAAKTGFSISMGAGAKIALGTVVAVLVTGLVMGNQETSKPRKELPKTESIIIQTELVPPIETETPVETEQQTESERQTETEQPIDTMSDMIGAEYEALLLVYEEHGVDKASWEAFITEIGANFKGSSTAYTEEYTLHVLYKQDKQLLLVMRESMNSSELEVKYWFGIIEPLPDMFDFIMRFDE